MRPPILYISGPYSAGYGHSTEDNSYSRPPVICAEGCAEGCD